MILQGVRSHPSGVRAEVALEGALVVLDQRHRHDSRSIHERLQGELLSDDLLLQDHSGPPDGSSEDLLDVGEGIVLVLSCSPPPSPLRRSADRFHGQWELCVFGEPDRSVKVLKDPKAQVARNIVLCEKGPCPNPLSVSIRAAFWKVRQPRCSLPSERPIDRLRAEPPAR